MIIEFEEVSGGSRKLALRPGQQLEFGSSAYASVALNDDSSMSAVHFRIRADREASYLQDLDSSNGTFLNDEPVESAVLRDGDRITAGQTRFRVSIRGGAPPESVAPLPAVTAPNPDRLRKSGDFHATYTAEVCNSGLTICRGNSEELAPAILAAQLGRAYPLYLLVDFHRLGQPPEAPPENSEHLVNWLGGEVADAMSPFFFAAADVPKWTQQVERSWGTDALVCIFSGTETSELLVHLRQAIRGGGDDASRGIAGYCWPGVLEPFLQSADSEATDVLMNGIDAVLVEAPGRPESWHVFGRANLPEILDKLGLEQQVHSSPEEQDEATQEVEKS